jgi:GAF domain-containing protein
MPQRWPRFTTAARERGFSAVHALPIRLRDQTLGALNLFLSKPRRVADDLIAVAQALADVVTISILQERAMRESTMVVEQLQGALESRILIEQAKGVLAERAQIDVAEAFAVMREFARSGNRKLVEVAAAVIDNSPDVTELTSRLTR